MSAEDARVVRALVMGLATGAAFWLGTYVLIREAVERLRR